MQGAIGGIFGVYSQVLIEVRLSALLEALRTGEGADLIQDALTVAWQELIEAEATGVIGGGRYR